MGLRKQALNLRGSLRLANNLVEAKETGGAGAGRRPAEWIKRPAELCPRISRPVGRSCPKTSPAQASLSCSRPPNRQSHDLDISAAHLAIDSTTTIHQDWSTQLTLNPLVLLLVTDSILLVL